MKFKRFYTFAISAVLAVLTFNSHAHTGGAAAEALDQPVDGAGDAAANADKLRMQLVDRLVSAKVYEYANAWAYVSTLSDEQVSALSGMLSNKKVRLSKGGGVNSR